MQPAHPGQQVRLPGNVQERDDRRIAQAAPWLANLAA